MKARKWIEKEKKYIDYELPEGATLCETDMNKQISCCSCGKKILYGNSYTSLTIHTIGGFGYVECQECYEKSFKE